MDLPDKEPARREGARREDNVLLWSESDFDLVGSIPFADDNNLLY
jgi:hypothetical protein